MIAETRCFDVENQAWGIVLPRSPSWLPRCEIGDPANFQPRTPPVLEVRRRCSDHICDVGPANLPDSGSMVASMGTVKDAPWSPLALS
jgi:hypothetical protein